MKKIAIVQSNYIPWKGYFDLIAAVDEFILYDDMQYTRRDWRNRNLIKTPQGLHWLTIPVLVKGKYFQKIRETEVEDLRWANQHWQTLKRNYQRTPFFSEIAAWLEPLYLDQSYRHLSDINRQFIQSICAYLGITTRISNSWDYDSTEGKTERLANLCVQAQGTEYISGPAARNYLDPLVFEQLDIALTWFDYDNYPAYAQQGDEFTHGVTILDLLFACGKDAVNYMKYVSR